MVSCERPTGSSSRARFHQCRPSQKSSHNQILLRDSSERMSGWISPPIMARATSTPCLPQVPSPAGSPCRTRAGKTAGKYHTARFVLVPALREELEVVVPADRRPGKAWTQGPHVEPADHPHHPGRPIRVGYARCSVATQELASQVDALKHAECKRIFSEKNQHPDQDPTRASERDPARPRHQRGRPRPNGHPHRPRDETPGPQRGRAHDPGRHLAGRRHPTRAAHRTTNRHLRPRRPKYRSGPAQPVANQGRRAA